MQKFEIRYHITQVTDINSRRYRDIGYLIRLEDQSSVGTVSISSLVKTQTALDLYTSLKTNERFFIHLFFLFNIFKYKHEI